MTITAERGHQSTPDRPASRPSHIRLDLQGMRAVAVLAVFADHLFGWPSGGFVGVDVFFVLSGFFITGVLIRERTRTGKISFRKFYAHRARRIIPSAMLVILATVIASYILLTATRAKSTFIDGLWATIFLSNWRFERVGTDYFAEGLPPSPLQHYWSLSIEEQFYFVWPILLLGLFALTRRYSNPRQRYGAKRQAWLASVMALICVASFAWACVQSASEPTAAYFSTFTRIWELGLGALIAISVPMLSRIPNSIRPALSYIGLAGVAVSLFVITPTSVFPGPTAALPVLSTALVIIAFVGAPVRAVPHLTNRGAVYVGEVSYTLYLWHWPVIVLLTAVMAEGLTYNLAVIVITAVLTVATFHLYENRIRRSNWLEEPTGYQPRTRIPRPTPAVWAFIGVLIAAGSLFGALLTETANNQSSTSQANQKLVVTDAGPEAGMNPGTADDDPCFGAAALATPGCALRDPAKELTPDVDRFTDDTQGAYECYRQKGRALSTCTYGYTGPDAKRLAIVGDSHAAMLLPGLAQHLNDNKWNLTTFVGYGCQWALRESGDCDRTVMPEVQKRLLAEKYDLVITTATRTTRSANEYAATWRPVVEGGSRVLVVGDNPSVSEETLSCVTRVSIGRDNSGECATPRSVALAEPDPLLAAAALVPGVRVLDMTDSFCEGDRCPAVIGDVIVYRDTAGHMTATYSQTLSPQLVTAVRDALG
ncbi:O-antigen acetylase [Gordonia phage BritBrat]|uniref:O-acetyltransferase domain protein n=1 Tax=Gordonia phage BritBrat TaxID=1838064 RepID=A0A166XZF2_9CAUD|nr:O-antigen acetylase [Gordonia phage BritBrat]ANA85238.1 O-acetyltransferase domain protein [Gordonia phage BritBrat]